MTGTSKTHDDEHSENRVAGRPRQLQFHDARERRPPPFVRDVPPSPPPAPSSRSRRWPTERGYHLEPLLPTRRWTTARRQTRPRLFGIPDGPALLGVRRRFAADPTLRLPQTVVGSDLQSALDNIKKAFDIVRANGFKVILRFLPTTTTCVNNRLDKPKPSAAAPRTALKPLLEAGRGTRPPRRAGFLGHEGEMALVTADGQRPARSGRRGERPARKSSRHATRHVQVPRTRRKRCAGAPGTSITAHRHLQHLTNTAGMDPIDKMSMPGRSTAA